MHNTPLHSPRGQRIVPARAGFTARPEFSGDRIPDHPRSRGVYLKPAGQLIMQGGSSPLARGLRRRRSRRRRAGRIIPARAGFTSRCRWRPWWPSDQPRSRGVYATHEVLGSTTAYPDQPRSRGVYRQYRDMQVNVAGSSPLARGLPYRMPRFSQCVWIIPARAGFTVLGAWRASGAPDHPRSRGVYTVAPG